MCFLTLSSFFVIKSENYEQFQNCCSSFGGGGGDDGALAGTLERGDTLSIKCVFV